jgi:hypothetical protein
MADERARRAAVLMWLGWAFALVATVSEPVAHEPIAHEPLGQPRLLSSLRGPALPSLVNPATPARAPAEWCDIEREGFGCSEVSNCTAKQPGFNGLDCTWFPHGAFVAVVFSDRLVETGMVALTSLCRHPTALYVLIVMQPGARHKPVPQRFLSCRTISVALSGALDYLRKAGWKPDTVCDGPGQRTHGIDTRPALLVPAHWDQDEKHSNCANHLRFYLPEFPILAKHDRIVFLDDDVVVQQDPVQLFRQPLRPATVFTANCDVNVWNSQCNRFDVGRSAYSHFFGQAMASGSAWTRVLDLLGEASHGTLSYYPNHPEWNFGFNLMSLKASREGNMSALYERLASLALARRYVKGSSLIFGLGMPFLAYSGRIECYSPPSRGVWHVLDGLGYVPPAEMEASGVSARTIADASVLHFNGGRKPWQNNTFAEYSVAMGYWGQNLTGLPGAAAPREQVDETPAPLELVLLLSGPRSGTEWFSKVMTDDNGEMCGSNSDRTAPPPEALMPFDVACRNPLQAPCLSWRVVVPQKSLCNLRRLCEWRYVLSAARGKMAAPPAESVNTFAADWQSWGSHRYEPAQHIREIPHISGLLPSRHPHTPTALTPEPTPLLHRNATSIFEGYLRRMLRLPTSAPQLPCRCENSQRVLFFKFFTDWLAPREVQKHLLYPRNSPFLRRYLRPGQTDEDAWHSVDALAVFRKLKARVVHLYREPISQYISVQIARRSELRGSGAASWHCFDADQSKCQSPRSIPHEDLLDIDLQDAGHFVSRARRMFKQASTFNPLVRIKFEDCIQNATQCIADTYRALGLPPRSSPILSIRVKSSLEIVRNREALNRSLHELEAGLLADAQHANPAKHRGSRLVKARNVKRQALTKGERNSTATSFSAATAVRGARAAEPDSRLNQGARPPHLVR